MPIVTEAACTEVNEVYTFTYDNKVLTAALDLQFSDCGDLREYYVSKINLDEETISDFQLDEAAIDRERDVILREMAEVNKQQEELVLDHLHGTAFQGTGLGRTILGPEENIRSLTRNDLSNYISAHYTAPRMVIAGAGAINHEELCGLASEHFGTLPTAHIQLICMTRIHNFIITIGLESFLN